MKKFLIYDEHSDQFLGSNGYFSPVTDSALRFDSRAIAFERIRDEAQNPTWQNRSLEMVEVFEYATTNPHNLREGEDELCD